MRKLTPEQISWIIILAIIAIAIIGTSCGPTKEDVKVVVFYENGQTDTVLMRTVPGDIFLFDGCLYSDHEQKLCFVRRYKIIN